MNEGGEKLVESETTKWDYTCTDVILGEGRLRNKLNEMGQNGWEAFAAISYGSVHVVVLYKKKVKCSKA
jgi:hypothetical protein